MCNNQHRIVEDRNNGIDVPFNEFRDVFQSKVLGIKNVIALLSPWDEPIYLTRAWCVLELFTASQEEECNLTIEMPESTRDDLKTLLMTSRSANNVVNKMYSTLGNTAIERAEASVPSDKENILKLVREGEDGGYGGLDIKVNELIRQWNKTTLIGFLNDAKADINDGKCCVMRRGVEFDENNYHCNYK